MKIFYTIMKIIAVLEILAIIVLIKLGGKLKEKRCSLKVKGRIVDRYTSYYRNGYHNIGYKTFIVIEYEYNNKIYSICRRVSPFSIHKPYDAVEIMINPSEPSETCSVLYNEKIREQRKTTKRTMVLGLVYIVPFICFIGLILFFAIGIFLDKINIIDFYSG